MGNHKEWRKIAKKERRRRIRQKQAQERCKLEKLEEAEKQKDENYQVWLKEQEKLEEFKTAENERLQQEENEKWLQREAVAQEQWRKLQEKIAKAKFERAQQDLRIRKEWEEEQKKILEAKEAQVRREEERQRCHEELMKRIEEFASGRGELPPEFRCVQETNSDKELCPFYSKIGVCRFGDNCSRNHRKPGVSKTILAKNFYSNFGIEHSGPNEYDTDILLENDDKDVYKHFKEFFDDVFPEFREMGNILQFKVCCNFERHLRGNTYIEYESLRDAVKAYRAFHGRWYGGKQVSLQFCDIPSWKQAICGLFVSKRCPKGKTCNFLHIFENPGNLFSTYGRREEKSSDSRSNSTRSWSRDKENGRNWRWSETPVREKREESNKDDSRRSRRDSKPDRHSRHGSRKRPKSKSRDSHRSSHRSRRRSRS